MIEFFIIILYSLLIMILSILSLILIKEFLKN